MARGRRDSEELTPNEEEFRKKIDAIVEVRADLVRQEQETTRQIAMLAVEARAADITMEKISSWIKVLDPKTGELRSVSRQATDQLVAKHENRPRASRKKAPTRKRQSTEISSAVNLKAFQ